jgi:hypothetical protein
MRTPIYALVASCLLAFHGCSKSEGSRDDGVRNIGGEGAAPNLGTGGEGASSGGNSDGFSGGGGTLVEPEDQCEAAMSETACDSASTSLASLEDCDDCWHGCKWLAITIVEEAERACEFGNSTAACRYVKGGEESQFRLVDHCRSYGDRGDNGFYREVSDGTEIAHLEEGFLVGFERCGSGGPAACDCLCDPDYPQADCIELEQASRSGVASGIVECPGVPAHRVGEVACTENVGACATSDDCGAGEVCVCAHPRNRVLESLCVQADCASNQDCANNEVCALAYDGLDSACGLSRLTCEQSHNSCSGEQCDVLDICGYDAESASFACQAAGSCR